MTNVRKFSALPIGAVVMSVALWAAVAHAQQKSGQAAGKVAALTPQDYIDIQQLVSSYPYGLDGNTDNGESYANLFAPGAVFGRPRTEGHDNLAALANTQPHGAHYTRHFITNHVIEPAPDGATGKQYLVIIDLNDETGRTNVVQQGGHYEDVYAKTARGWRFKSRQMIASKAGA